MVAPTITSCSPSSGPKAGGTAVEIIGTVLTGATAVTFDGDNAARYAVIDATHILAVTPAGTGTGDVVITTPGGDDTLTDGFTYTPTYTTAAIVKLRCSDIDTTNLLDTVIDGLIIQAEGIIDAVIRKSFRGASADYTFDADKHGLIRDTCTCLAAWLCITYDVEQFSTGSYAALTADLLWAEVDRNLAILSDERTVKFLGGL